MELLKNYFDNFTTLLCIAQITLPALLFFAIQSDIARDNKILKKKNEQLSKKVKVRKKIK